MRWKSSTLTAVHLAEAQQVVLPTGQPIVAAKGDWLIVQGEQIVDVVASLDARYERVHVVKLSLDASVAQRLEATLGLGATRDPYTLLEAVERLARISIGTIHVEFTPGQLEEIKHRAGKRGHTVQQELQAAVDRVKDEIFYRG